MALKDIDKGITKSRKGPFLNSLQSFSLEKKEKLKKLILNKSSYINL